MAESNGKYPEIKNDNIAGLFIITTIAINAFMEPWWGRLLVTYFSVVQIFYLGVDSGSLYGGYHSAAACKRRQCGQCPFRQDEQ